ncbi:hypothetical protein [Streptomyces sp. NPDC088915]|uniref:hypothetical protein n=1 Tax=Streptomyces sp. NPDC088915 TaxID=3365912 RepID=UPI0038274934
MSAEPEAVDVEVVDAELVDDEALPDTTRVRPRRFRVTQHTMLRPGQLPPSDDDVPPWTDADFRLTDEEMDELEEPALAASTLTNRTSSVGAFERWCAAQRPVRIAHPCTTSTYTSYGLHLIRLGKKGQYVPDSVGVIMSRIWNSQPVDYRPDPSAFKGRLKLWRKEWAANGGEVQRSAAVTLPYNLRIIDKIDESTPIGKRDAFLCALAYANLHREMELADLLVPRLRIYDTGVHVVTATSKTDQTGAGSGRYITDRADLQLVRRARAWYAVLRELGADGPTDPVFRALTTKGRLRKYPEGRERGNRLAEGSLNERLQLLAERAGVPYIDGKKVTSHSWRAGANTDMAAVGVSLAARNKAGRWADGSRTADLVYDRPHGLGTDDPLAKVPLHGGPAHAAVAQARAEEADT